MLGRNCGLYSEDDLLLNPDGDGGAVVGDSCCPAASGTLKPASRASSMQPSVSRWASNVLSKDGGQHQSSLWVKGKLHWSLHGDS